MRRVTRVVVLIGAVAVSVAPMMLSQSQNQPASPKPTFEVVSIKPSPPNLQMRGGGPRGDRLTLTGVPLARLLQMAFQKPSPTGGAGIQLQIVGGPPWINSELYDIQAKADCSGGALSREQMALMMQAMLEDRFQLKAHMETRELPVYNLVAAKDGPKMKRSEDQTPPPIVALGPLTPCSPAATAALPAPPPPPPPGGGGARGGMPNLATMPRGATMIMVNQSGMTMQVSSAPLSQLANMLQQFAGRPVIDKTEIKDLFDIMLTFSPEGLNTPFGPTPPPGGGPIGPGGPGAPGGAAAPPADPVPSLFTAIQELGLRLESTKGPVEVLVVEGAQKPTEN